MALLSLLYNRPIRTEISRTVGGRKAVITMDAQLRESFTAEAEPTIHPVEDGADVTDHVILKPKRLSIEGMVTETPLSFGASIQGAAATVSSAIGSSLGGTLGVIGGLGGGIAGGYVAKTLAGLMGFDVGRELSDFIKEFVAVRDARQPVTIQTGLTQYQDYILRSVQLGRDQSSGKSMRVVLEFQEFLRANLRTEKVAIPKIRSAVPLQELGRQGKEAVTGDKLSKGSVLWNLIVGAKGG